MELKYSPLKDGEQVDNLVARRIISASRRLLENPYAYLDDTGAYSALSNTPSSISVPIDKVSDSRRLLQDPYAYLDDHGEFTAIPERAHVRDNAFPVLRSRPAFDYFSLRKGTRKNSRDRYSFAEIEQKAIMLQKRMWVDRSHIWPGANIYDPIDILDPTVAFRLIGFNYDVAETLGQYFIGGKQVEVAGLIDDTENQVRISQKFPANIRNFTAAHELGHALLHEARGLHRDRPLDGSVVARNKLELEADKFASFFLMPEKLVRARFERVFCTHQFYLNEDTAFALVGGNSINVATIRDLSRILASTESYNGIRFRSLASQFGVSVEAMAIRIEELGLLVY